MSIQRASPDTIDSEFRRTWISYKGKRERSSWDRRSRRAKGNLNRVTINFTIGRPDGSIVGTQMRRELKAVEGGPLFITKGDCDVSKWKSARTRSRRQLFGSLLYCSYQTIRRLPFLLLPNQRLSGVDCVKASLSRKNFFIDSRAVIGKLFAFSQTANKR